MQVPYNSTAGISNKCQCEIGDFICCSSVLGLASIVTSVYLCLYYNVINAWSFWYLFHSFQVSC